MRGLDANEEDQPGCHQQALHRADQREDPEAPQVGLRAAVALRIQRLLGLFPALGDAGVHHD